MDPTEDLSARVLLRNVLSTEPLRTPITRSASKAQKSASRNRRSSTLAKKDAGIHTPQEIMRRSMKYNLRESATRKSLPATTRTTVATATTTTTRTSGLLRRPNTPGLTSMLFEDDTPRHLLRNILQTEPVRSPVVNVMAAAEEPSSANSSISRKRPSIELSGLDLPDLTLGNAGTLAKGLSRKRPRRSLNVTAFEKRLKDASDFQEEHEESADNYSSLSLSSSTSLSLKTPIVDVRSEKRGLQRRVSNRRKITEEEFGAAVNKQWKGEDHGNVKRVELNHSTYSDGFTLGLSELSEPNITTDIINCNTALYTQSDPMTSTFSIMTMQDKDTAMGTRLKRQELKEEVDAAEENGVEAQTEDGERATDSQTEEDDDNNGEVDFLSEDGIKAGSQSDEPQSEKGDGEDGAVDSQSGEEEVRSQSEEEEAEPQSGEEGAGDSQSGEEEVRSQEEEAELLSGENEVRPQSEEEAAEPQSGEEEVRSQEEEAELQSGEEGAGDSQSGEEEVRSQSEEEEAELLSGENEVRSQSEEEEEAAEPQSGENEVRSQSEEEEADLLSGENEVRSQSEEEEEEEAAEPQSGEEEVRSQSEEEEAEPEKDGADDSESKEDVEAGPQSEDGEDPDANSQDEDVTESREEDEHEEDGEKDFHLEMTHDVEGGSHLSEEAAAVDPVEEDEEWEDEENEELPCKTPAFVKEKRNFFLREHETSPSVVKNIQTSRASEAVPAAKPKQVRERKKRPATKQAASLPKSYLMNVFRHFAKTKVSSDIYPVLQETMDQFFDRMADDLESYANHAKRKTIDYEDTVLLLKRLGYVNDKVPVEVLIEKYLRMDQRRLLIPVATSGNVVIPRQRR